MRLVLLSLVFVAAAGHGSAHAQPPDPATPPASADSATAPVAESGEGDADGAGQDAETSPSSSPSDFRIGVQGRLAALNVVLVPETAEAGEQVPFATIGVRFLDQRLFAGIGFGLFGVESANTGLSVTPLATFDILRDGDRAALYAATWLSFANFDDDRALGNDNVFVWGLTAAAGVRVQPLAGLGVGAEWGWGFVSLNRDGSNFVHGFIGNLVLEATFGI